MSTLLVIGASNEEASGFYAGGASAIWPYKLRDLIAAAHPNITYTLDNRSVAGKDTKYFADNIATYTALNPDFVLIGGLLTNDVSWWGQNNPAWVNSLAESEANLRAMVTAFRAVSYTHGDNPLGRPFLVFKQAPIAAQGDYGTGTANPVGAYAFGRDRARLVQANDMLCALGRELGVPVTHSFDKAIAAGHRMFTNETDTYLVDGVHQTAAYHTAEADWAMEFLRMVPVPERDYTGTEFAGVDRKIWNGTAWVPTWMEIA